MFHTPGRRLSDDLVMVRTGSVDRSVVIQAADQRAALREKYCPSASTGVHFVWSSTTTDRHVVCLVEHGAAIQLTAAASCITVHRLEDILSVKPSPLSPSPIPTDEQQRYLRDALPQLIQRLVGHHSDFHTVLVGYGHHIDAQGYASWDSEPALLVHVQRQGWIPWGEECIPNTMEGRPVRIIQSRCVSLRSLPSGPVPLRPDREHVVRPGAVLSEARRRNQGEWDTRVSSLCRGAWLACSKAFAAIGDNL